MTTLTSAPTPRECSTNSVPIVRATQLADSTLLHSSYRWRYTRSSLSYEDEDFSVFNFKFYYQKMRVMYECE